MKMNLSLVRFAVLWIWVVTIFFAIFIFLYKGSQVKMETDEVISNLASIIAIITPQVTIIFSFIFKDHDGQQSLQVKENPHLTIFALSISLLYHVSFWLLLWFGVVGEKFGETMKANTDAILRTIGFVSILGLSPVGFLFSAKTNKSAHN